MGAKRRKKRGIKQKSVLSKIMERTAQNQMIFGAGAKKEKSRNPHGYWIFRWRRVWDSNPRALADNRISRGNTVSKSLYISTQCVALQSGFSFIYQDFWRFTLFLVIFCYCVLSFGLITNL
jgi:hypothetical protein